MIGDRFVISLVDIDEHKRMTDELAASQQRFRDLFDLAPFSCVITDFEGRLLLVNDYFCQSIGLTPDEMINRTGSELGRIADSDLARMVMAEIEAHGICGPREITVDVEGKTAHLIISARVIDWEDGQAILSATVDITKRKQAEAELQQVRKLEAIGQLAGGVAHDFNNMLGAILGAAELLDDAHQTADELRQHREIIVNAAARAADLTRDLLTFSRKQPLRKAPVSVQRIITDACGILKRTADPRIALEIQVPESPLVVIGDATQLENALLNLMINATHAMLDGGRLSVTARQADEQAHLTIADTGTGIAPEHLDRIFEPFFTTKADGKGTGLGLSAVFGTVQEHGGEIQVDSQLGHGTRFDIRLPLAAADAVPVAAPPPRQTARADGSRRIMVVDDESMLRDIARRVLERNGYVVDTAENGRQAVELFTTAPDGHHDLVILDMSMPEMNGAQCLDALRAVRPDVRVIMATGYSSDVRLSDAQRGHLAGLLDKPFSKQSLLTMVQQALERP